MIDSILLVLQIIGAATVMFVVALAWTLLSN